MFNKRKIIIIIIFIIPTFLFSQENNILFNKKHKIPSADVKTLDGDVFNTSDFSNNQKPIIINFWATNCKPCIKELSIIADLYDDWIDETGVKIIAISTDDSKTIANVLPFVSGKAWDYEFYTDVNGDFKRAMNVNVIPHTFIINSNLEIVWQHISYSEGDELKYIEIVRKIISEELKNTN